MSKKNIEKHIPKAIKVLERTFENGVIPSAYNGYISSFGASVIQSGLKPTLALFENTDANTKEDKSYLTKIILQILDQDTQESSLLKYILPKQKNEAYLKQQILDIAVAVKLSIRTFKLKKGE
ncbi:type III-B CRISPR module-associated protein Cmr5 [Sulfurimonas sp. NWX367]|uniref:type III-B CRISPR module-associated protein Cmr5 n=1 Tax=unclassified Sulfurimonas TaxID=2623549 RepID=UPI0032049E13